MLRRFFAFLFVMILAPSFAVAVEEVRIGIAVPWPGYGFFELARDNGLLDGYDVKVSTFGDPTLGYEMLSSGKIDVYASTIDYVPIAISRKQNIAAVAYTNPSFGVDQVVLAPGVAPEDLRGRTVAAPRAFIGQLVMGVWLERHGIKPEDVEWLDANAEEAVGPMVKRQVAAAYMYEPWTTKLVGSMSGAHEVANTADLDYIQRAMFGDAIYMNRDFIKNRRQAALDVLRARWQAVGVWHDHTKRENAAFAKRLNWPPEDVEFVMGTNGKYFEGGIYINDFDESARYCGVLKGRPPFGADNGGLLGSVEQTNRWWVDLGVLDAMFQPGQGIDCSLMGDLVAEGFRQSFISRR